MNKTSHDYEWTSRLNRALTQRIYVIEANAADEEYKFNVMGSTNTRYDVTIDSSTVMCSCPDHTTRGSFCKHIICVLVRVLRIPQSRVCADYYEQGHFCTSHITLDACVAFFGDKKDIGVAIETDEKGYVKCRPIDEDDDCPICFENFFETKDEATTYCKAMCGKSVHESCFARWAQRKNCCVYCRAEWIYN